jgi:hypothetical protein
MLVAITSRSLQVLLLCLEFLDLSLKQAILMLQGGDFLFLLEILLLEGLDLLLELFDLGVGIVGLDAQRLHFLFALIRPVSLCGEGLCGVTINVSGMGVTARIRATTLHVKDNFAL